MSTPIAAENRAPDTPYRWRWVAMIVLVLGFMLDLLNVTVVNVGLPAIQAGLGGTSAQVGWIATAYLLAFAVTLITAARLGDLYGRKRVFLTGLAGFAVAGVLSGLAQSPGELIAARAAQGVAAAIVAPQVLASLFVLFRGPERATVLGVFGVVAGFAQAGGLVLGGVLVTADVGGLGWRAVFWATVPVAVVLLALGLRLIPENRAEDAQRPRWPAAAALTAGLVAIVFPLLEGQSYGWAAWIWLLFAAGIAAVASVAVVEHRRADRRAGALLPWELLRQRNNGVALIVQLVGFAAFSGFQLVFVLWLQDGRHYSALRTGLVTVAFSLGALSVAPLVGRLTVRFGRMTVVAGTLLGVIGTVAVLAVSRTAATEIVIWALVPGLFVVGVGINLVQPPLTTLFLSTVPTRYAGSASGLWTTAQQFGGALGVATLSTVFFATGDHETGFATSVSAVAVALAVSAVLCLALPVARRTTVMVTG